MKLSPGVVLETAEDLMRAAAAAGVDLRQLEFVIGRPTVPTPQQPGRALPSLADIRANKALVFGEVSQVELLERIPWSSLEKLEHQIKNHESLSARIHELNKRAATRHRFSVADPNEPSADLTRMLAVYGLSFRYFFARLSGGLPAGEREPHASERRLGGTIEGTLALGVGQILERGPEIGGVVQFPYLDAGPTGVVVEQWPAAFADHRMFAAAVDSINLALELFFQGNEVSATIRKRTTRGLTNSLRRVQTDLEAIAAGRYTERLIILLNDLLEREQPWAAKEDRQFTIGTLLALFGPVTGSRRGDPGRRTKDQLARARTRHGDIVTPRKLRQRRS